MCKLFLTLLLISLVSSSLSLSTNNCEEKIIMQDFLLHRKDPSVIKFVDAGWNKLVAENKTRDAKEKGNIEIICSRVQTINNAQRYTIVVNYSTELVDSMLKCYIYVFKDQPDSLSIDCWRGLRRELLEPSDRVEYLIYYQLFDDKQFCPDN